MSEIEVPLEKVQEDIHHALSHGGSSHNPPMMSQAAILSAILAVAAAISALFAGHYANDAMIEQMQSSDHWSYYQAKGIKLAIAEARYQTENTPDLAAKIEKYKSEQAEIKREADVKEAESREHLLRHEKLAASVTFFQVAIALTAIAVLTRKRTFLMFAASLGGCGLIWTLLSQF
jgi:hypothetical protein